VLKACFTNDVIGVNALARELETTVPHVCFALGTLSQTGKIALQVIDGTLEAARYEQVMVAPLDILREARNVLVAPPIA
jgi:hypothetical protein